MKKINSKYNYIVAIGIAFVLSGIFLIARQLIDSKFSSAILSFGIALIIIGIFRKIRKNKMPEKDERIKKLSLYGLGYSWLITFLFITIFFWFDYFGFVNINTQQYYSILLFVMIISAVVFQKIFYKKGDIE